MVPGLWEQLIFTLNNGTAKIYKDGILLSTRTMNSPANWTGFSLGENVDFRNKNGGNVIDGDVAEVMVYNTALSDTDRTTVQNYLNNKYNSVATPVQLGHIYNLTNKNSRKNLDVYMASAADETNVQQYTPGTTNAQQWKIEDAGNGYYKLTAQCSNKVLDVYLGSGNDGANIQQYTWNGSNAQLWKIIDVGGGYYKLQSKASVNAGTNCIMSVANSSLNDEANVYQGTDSNLNSQMWSFTFVQ